MKINGQHYRTIRLNEDGYTVMVIDQTVLPFEFKLITISSAMEAAEAIKSMRVRGAPLIGTTAAYGLAMALKNDSSDQGLSEAYNLLLNTRPTAINLKWALDRVMRGVSPLHPDVRAEQAYITASSICEEDVAINKAIGGYGLELIRQVAKAKGQVNILTHCNAGWLGTVDYGTALSPIYMAHDEGISVHVWVDETRPRNQGALTAWELGQHGVPHTYITDNAGGHVLQQGLADMVIVGTDRVAANGDVCNKIGTYLKALAAHDCGVPFYVAVPTPSIDWDLKSGADIPIEQRSPLEVTNVQGWQDGKLNSVRVTPDESTKIANYGFDVTPNRLIAGLITEHGIFKTPAEITASRAAA